MMLSARSLVLASLFLATVCAHGDHGASSEKPVVGDDADWLTRHMAEEHHIANFDPSSAFTLHDFNGDGYWVPAEIERTYGLHHVDGDGDGVDADANTASDAEKEALRAAVVARVLGLFDTDGDGRISRIEWRHGYAVDGKTLPDMGTGPGHHGDDEYEYEIHHWEKYHDENTKLEDLTHPEDIAHFQHHERLEAEEAQRLALEAQRESLSIVLDNVPAVFRRGG